MEVLEALDRDFLRDGGRPWIKGHDEHKSGGSKIFWKSQKSAKAIAFVFFRAASPRKTSKNRLSPYRRKQSAQHLARARAARPSRSKSQTQMTGQDWPQI